MSNVTRWLNATPGSRDEELFANLYTELKRIARSRLAGESPGRTLDTCGLVHEAWMRLEGSSPEEWRDRQQFYAAATEAMRRILIEAARRRLAAKRGGGEAPIPMDQVELLAPLPDERLIAVHEVLEQLEQENKMNAQIVKLRYFAGLKHDEIAGLLEVNEKTVRRRWEIAKVWLFRALDEKT